PAGPGRGRAVLAPVRAPLAGDLRAAATARRDGPDSLIERRAGALDRLSRADLSFPGASSGPGSARAADVAQLVEQRFCKPPVPGSSPVVGSIREALGPTSLSRQSTSLVRKRSSVRNRLWAP